MSRCDPRYSGHYLIRIQNKRDEVDTKEIGEQLEKLKKDGERITVDLRSCKFQEGHVARSKASLNLLDETEVLYALSGHDEPKAQTYAALVYDHVFPNVGDNSDCSRVTSSYGFNNLFSKYSCSNSSNGTNSPLIFLKFRCKDDLLSKSRHCPHPIRKPLSWTQWLASNVCQIRNTRLYIAVDDAEHGFDEIPIK